MNSLFEPVTIADLELQNRIAMAPLTRQRADLADRKFKPPAHAKAIRVTGQESGPGLRPTVLGRSVRRPACPVGRRAGR